MDSYNNDDDSTTNNNANMPQCVVIKCKKKIKIFLIGYMPPLLYFTGWHGVQSDHYDENGDNDYKINYHFTFSK